MKNILLFFVLTAIACLFFTNCEEDNASENKEIIKVYTPDTIFHYFYDTSNNFLSEQISFDSASWSINEQDSNAIYAEAAVSALSASIVDSGVVLVYKLNKSNAWAMLPLDNENIREEFKFAEEHLRIERIFDTVPAISSQTYKLIVLQELR